MSQIPPPPPGPQGPQPPYQSAPPPGYVPNQAPANEYQQKAQQAADAARAAAQDAAAAFQTMMKDPVGSLALAYQQLGESKALGVGAVFGVVGAIAIALTPLLSPMSGMFGFGDLIKMLIGQLIGVAGCAAGFIALSKPLQTKTTINGAAFVSGAAYLAFGVALLAGAILLKILGPGKLGLGLMGLCGLTGMCFAVMLLFCGWRQIFGASDRSASIGVPGCIATAFLISQIVGALLN